MVSLFLSLLGDIFQAYLVDGIVLARNSQVSDAIGLRNELVQLGVGVVTGQPHGLAIGWIFAAAEVLFLSCVDDRNAVSHNGEGGGVLGEGDIIGEAVFPG